jgi:hypothetical protein
MGVIDIPYVNAETPKARHSRLRKGKKAPKVKRDASTITTGDVAEILEAKYHPMEIYFELHGQEVADKMTESLVGAMENVLAGAPLSVDPFGDAEAFIDSGFKDFITTGEMERLGYPGVPTKASIERKSARFKKGKSKKERPSFVDTGLYVDSSKSEVVD